MSIPLFGEPEHLPLCPQYSPQFHPFSLSSILQLYELVDPFPIYSTIWSANGTDLFIPTSANGLHHIQLPLETRGSQLPLDSSSPPSLIRPTIARLTSAPIIKILPNPNSPLRFAVLTLSEGIKVFDIILSPRGKEFKLFTSINHPHSSILTTTAQTIPSLSPSPSLQSSFIDFAFKSSSSISALDNNNNIFTYNLESSTPNIPSKSSLFLAPTSRGNRAFGLIPPTLPDLFMKLYPQTVTKLPGTLHSATPSENREASAMETTDNNAIVFESYKATTMTAFAINNLVNDQIVTVTSHGDVMLHDSKSMMPFCTKKITTSSINSISLSAALSNRFIRDLYVDLNMKSLPLVNRPIQDDLYTVTSQVQSEQFLAAGSNDGIITLLSATDLSILYTIQQHDNPVIFLSFSPCTTYLASISLNTKSLSELDDGNIHMVKGLFCITHVTTGHTIYQRPNHGITAFSWNPVYPIGAFISLVCVSTSQRDYHPSFRHKPPTTTQNINFISQLSLIDFSRNTFPPLQQPLTSIPATLNWPSSLSSLPHLQTAQLCPTPCWDIFGQEFHALSPTISLPSGTLNNPLNKSITFDYFDLLSAPNLKHAVSNPWVAQIQHKMNYLATHSAYSQLSDVNKTTVQKTILNQHSSFEQSTDRFASINFQSFEDVESSINSNHQLLPSGEKPELNNPTKKAVIGPGSVHETIPTNCDDHIPGDGSTTKTGELKTKYGSENIVNNPKKQYPARGSGSLINAGIMKSHNHETSQHAKERDRKYHK
jgi:hypothetical protein